MKTYHTFTTPPDVTKYHPRGHYHWVKAPSGIYICVLDSGAVPEASWTPLPHLLEHATAAGLTDFGCVATDTMFQAATKLGKNVHRFFHPSG